MPPLLGGRLGGLLTALAAFAVGACLDAAAVTCDDGALCPSGYACVPGGCARQDEVAACDGKAELDACEVPGRVVGICASSVCIEAGCGNEVVEPSEQCDDGNVVDGDGCSARCDSREACGDGVTDRAIGEQCDDGNLVDGDGCQASCQDPACGDGIVDASRNEACDAGVLNADVADAPCRTTCRLPRCGDHLLDASGGEVCDDGNLDPGDGCSPDCASDETCGNGVLDVVQAELCDDGNLRGHDGCGAACLPEPRRWQRLDGTGPSARLAEVGAYDAARRRYVMFGGNDGFYGEPAGGYRHDTWEWDGSTWSRRYPATTPPGRYGSAMVYDSWRHRTLMFGGDGGAYLNDLWSYDGVDWAKLTPATAVGTTRYHAGAFDSRRGRAVFVGGNLGTAMAIFDGTDWTTLTPSPAPSARSFPGFVYDPVHDQLVLFGGTAGQNETWTFDGMTWTQRFPATVPPGRNTPAMWFDTRRARVIMFGGQNLGDTWSWDGTDWTLEAPVASPPGQSSYHAAYDLWRGAGIVQGGHIGYYLDTLWEYDGATWTAGTAAAAPPARSRHALAYDPIEGRTVMIGGYGAGGPLADAWTFDGTSWAPLVTATTPPARAGASLAYDPARRRLVLTGGASGDGTYPYGAAGGTVTMRADTWEWDGVDWQLAPVGPAPARIGAAMAYDAARGALVMVGGWSGDGATGVAQGDAWAYDGISWTNIATDGDLPARFGHALVADERGGRLLAIAGWRDASGDPYDDTWQLVGDTWSELPQVVPPAARGEPVAVFDAARQRVRLQGGSAQLAGGYAGLADGYELDDLDTWVAVDDGQAPAGRAEAAGAYDLARQTVVLFGGRRNGALLDDTWMLSYDDAAPREACVAGLDYDGDGNAGCADADCWGTCAPLCPPAAATCFDADAGCGDGACTTLEDCGRCPIDCGACTAMCGDYACNGDEDVTSCPGDCP